MQVIHFVTSDGKDVIDAWLDRLRDKRALSNILRRVGRIERDGYFGDHKYLRDGVSELRIDEGTGYRVYYAQDDAITVLLLNGGDKSTQATDIDRAVKYWQDFQQRRPKA